MGLVTMKEILESMKKRINNDEEMVFVISGREECGMSCMAMNIGNYYHSNH